MSELNHIGLKTNTTHIVKHMCMSIQGCLNNYKRKKIKFMTNEDGSQATDKEAREYLKECLDKGWRVIPMSDECDSFDYQKGCPGHEITGYKDKDYGYVITVEAYKSLPETEKNGYNSIWK